MLDKTIIVIAADHGEAFEEHGFEGHAKGLYTEVQSTPWIMWLPFDLDETVVVDAQAANIDIWPTVLDLLGLEPIPNADGRSLVPAILAAARGEPVPGEFAERSVFSQLDANWGRVGKPSFPMVSVLSPPFRFHHRSASPLRDELFDHRRDPTEQENIVENDPERAKAMREVVDRYLEDTETNWDATEIQLDEMRLNQLRALGYKIE